MTKDNIRYTKMTVKELRELVNSIPPEDDDLMIMGLHEWDGGGEGSHYLKFDKFVCHGGTKTYAITTFKHRSDYEETELEMPWSEKFEDDD